MQFSEPGVDGIEHSMADLRRIIADRGPYDFVKTGHHTSHNAVDLSFLEDIDGVEVVGHSGGRNDSRHPNSDVLELLRDNRSRFGYRFCRTDRNGLTEIRIGDSRVWVYKSRGRIDDFSRNRRGRRRDVAPLTEPLASISTAAQGAVQPTTSASGERVEVIARIPHRKTRVTLTIDIAPHDVAVSPVEGPPSPPPERRDTPRLTKTRAPRPRLHIADDRQLPNLLFVTSHVLLAQNIGSANAEHALRELKRHSLEVFDVGGDVSDTIHDVAARVRRQLVDMNRAGQGAEGVVILGGYDVMPSQRLDVLEPELRGRITESWDRDRFIVWSDDVYGCIDGDGLPELPVSRIPDGQSAELVFSALQAKAMQVGSRFGIRNIKRPFAEEVFARLAGAGNLLVSEPTTADTIPANASASHLTYYMLHGSNADTTAFWGESLSGPHPEAVNMDTVPEMGARVVFTGCCWGALTANTTAWQTRQGSRPSTRTADDSIALRYLESRAMAFVGCTGTHYSPIEEPYGYFGQPMHEAFWELIEEGYSPAESLLGAKLRYVEGLPYRSQSDFDVAIELKILRQFTCLGLGW
jgi:hypothetical protein